jgi:hypothetical protein
MKFDLTILPSNFEVSGLADIKNGDVQDLNLQGYDSLIVILIATESSDPLSPSSMTKTASLEARKLWRSTSRFR